MLQNVSSRQKHQKQRNPSPNPAPPVPQNRLIRKLDFNVNLFAFYIVLLTSLVVASTEIFQGKICYKSSTYKNSTHKIVEDVQKCEYDNFNVDKGIPDVQFEMNITLPSSNFTIISSITVFGGWPRLNSILHFVGICASLVMAYMLKENGGNHYAIGWLVIAIVWIMFIIIDALTLSGWQNTYCNAPVKESISNVLSGVNSRTLKSSKLISSIVTQFQNYHSSHIDCGIGMYMFQLCLNGIAAMSASINVCIAMLNTEDQLFRHEDTIDDEYHEI